MGENDKVCDDVKIGFTEKVIFYICYGVFENLYMFELSYVFFMCLFLNEELLLLGKKISCIIRVNS